VLTDGENYVSMLPAQDHKRLSDGDVGPNTGGMGAYAPVGIATPDVMDSVRSRIIEPTLQVMREHGNPFRGLLYCGLMLTSDGPKVVEFNCRFGDPETQVVLPLMESGLIHFMLRTSEAGGMAGAPAMTFRAGAAVTVVVAAPGYPDAPVTGTELQLPADTHDTFVFHAGTRRAPDGRLLTAGGRVVAVTAVADSLAEARDAAVSTAEHVRFPGRQFRRDIGRRELIRRAGVA
jgi:phosphoribosylamine--glycine ligase